ncbi:hypothetical protein AA313_de0207845 [Arthrobotrys entomopaga]|nr:hypothetical protein AA313_de0207845 [Arthrobotrys entomopaga]
MSSTDELVNKFLDALAGMPAFPHHKFSDRLFNKVRESYIINPFKSALGAADTHDHYATGASTHLDDIDISDQLNEMAAQSLAQATANLGETSDQFGFRHCIDKTSAGNWFKDSIIRVAPFLVAEHLSWELSFSKHGLPPLRELRKNQEFVKAYRDKLLNKNFIQGTIQSDVSASNHNRSTFLLFALAYFESNPKLSNVVCNEEIWTRQVGTVGAAWIVELVHTLQTDAVDAANHISRSFSPIFARNDDGRLCVCNHDELTKKLFVNNRNLKKVIAQNHPASTAVTGQIETGYKKLQKGVFSGWNSVQDVLLQEWNNQLPKFDAAIQSYAIKSRDDSGPLPGGTYLATYYGDEVAKLIDTGKSKYPKYFTKSAPKHHTSEFIANYSFQCLAAGTVILTKDGEKPVEELQDDEVLIARGSLPQYSRDTIYGKTSNEDRKVPVGGQTLFYGFNDDTPFFTSSHIFHTTTGLRAIDPTLASRQNPTVTVGKLDIGHVVFRLSGNAKYSFITIQSFSTRREQETKFVYEIHLSEGRSYHANGYLTSVSYPTTTPKTVAAELEKLAPYDRLKLLYKFPELESVLQKYDSATLSEALTEEIKQEAKRRTARLYTVRDGANDQLPLSDINRTYVVERRAEENVDGSNDNLPQTINLQEGVISINDNAPLDQASIDPKERSLIWTRQVRDDRYEHGILKLDTTGLAGRGAVFYTTEAEADSSQIEGFQKETSYFSVTSRNPTYKVAKASFDGKIADNQLMAEKPAPPDEDDTSNDLTFTLQYETAAMTLASDLPTDLRKIQNPASFGNIIIHTKQVGGSSGLKMVVARIPFLDILRDAFNLTSPDILKDVFAKLGKDGAVNPDDYQAAAKIESLYEAPVTQDKHGRMVANIRMIDARTLHNAADFNNGLQKTFNTITKQTGLSVPMIFQELEVTISNDFSSAWGQVYEWNPDMKGMMGARHFLHSTTLEEEVAGQRATREGNSTAAGNLISSNPSVPISTPQLPPSTAASNLDPMAGGLDCDALKMLDGYSEYSVSSASIRI